MLGTGQGLENHSPASLQLINTQIILMLCAYWDLSQALIISFLCYQTGDWTWLKEFYQRLIDQKWQRKKKSKEHWYQKAILSKFLYYRYLAICLFLSEEKK